MTDASSAVYVRTDTDSTTIVAPTVKIGGAVDKVTVDTTLSIDAWTGASIDVMTAATEKIKETRNEVDAAIGYEGRIVKLSANYRLSLEPDYVSHGLTLSSAAELFGKNTTIAFDLLGTLDKVGRSHDPNFSQPLDSLGARVAIAQTLDMNTIAELGWQTTLVDGYQASPYRFVAIGDLGTCSSNAPLCIAEQVPTRRLRHALSLRGRRALGHDLSTGLEYRFYFDDWGMQSHAIQPDLAWRVTDEKTLSVRYRYATQSEASFYRPRYLDLMSTGGYATRDRKLSALFSNEIGLQYVHRIEQDDGNRIIHWGARSTLSRTDYLAFVGLDHVWALEITILAGLELP